MKVLVISGFLGAGKTTFLKELARRTRHDFAVMENEYGEVGIDGDLLRQEGEKLNIWELTEGCICCTRKSDFASDLLTIANTVDPEYLIVEPTGVGMLSQVLENISRIRYEKITLLSPVTVLDGHSFDRYRREFPEIYRDQVSSAGTILVSKMEAASHQDLDALEAELRQMNPQARILTEHYRRQPDAWFEALLSRGLSGSLPPPRDQDSGLETLSLRDLSLESPDQLVLLLNGVVSGVFGSICRAKGCLPAGDALLRFDVADRVYSITGCSPDAEPQAVFIGRDLHRSQLRQILQRELQVQIPAGKRRR